MSERNGGRTKRCSEYPQCRHYKHGYTRKDHPEPFGRVKPVPKTDAEIVAIAKNNAEIIAKFRAREAKLAENPTEE